MTDERKARGLTNRRNLLQQDFEDDYEVDVRSEKDGYLSERPASMTDMRRGLDAAAVRSGDVAEVWVSPDGDDSNPGTRSAPLASIQEGVEALKGRHGPNTTKIVYLAPTGEDNAYIVDETIVINESNFIVKSSAPMGETRIEAGADIPLFLVTALTDASVFDYLDDGGPEFDHDFDLGDLTHSYEYTGPLTDRTVYDTTETVHGVQLEGLRFSCSGPIESYAAVNFVSVPDGEGQTTVQNCSVSGCRFLPDLEKFILLKNVEEVHFSFTQTGFGPLVIDNSRFISFDGGRKRGSRLINQSRAGIICVYRTNDDLDTRLKNTGYSIRRLSDDWQVGMLFSRRDTSGSGSGRMFDSALQTTLTPLREVVISGDGNFGRSDRNLKIGNQQIGLEAPIVLEDSSSMNATDGTVYDVRMESSGDLVLRGTKIQNNLTIEGGTTTLKNVTIEGNLIQSGDADIDFTNVTVLGNVDLADDAGTATWRGGSYYGELTDPGDKLGDPSPEPGEYLNVT